MFFRPLTKPIVTVSTSVPLANGLRQNQLSYTPQLTASLITAPSQTITTTNRINSPQLRHYDHHLTRPTPNRSSSSPATTTAPPTPIYYQQQRQFSSSNGEGSRKNKDSKPSSRGGWLGNRISKIRLWANSGKESDRWDPWSAKPRDIEIGEHKTNLILQNAQAMRQKQLQQIEKFQKKAADKEASIKTPIAYAAQKRAEKVPFRTQVSNAVAWLKNPQNYLSNWYKEHDLAELSFTQKCLYIYWRQTLAVLAAVILIVPRIPVVRDVLDDLEHHRDRKKRGVLGLDEYCSQAKKYSLLKFYRTNDWTFDVQYLQKTSLRDLYVIKDVIKALKDISDERVFYLEQSLAKLIELEASSVPDASGKPTVHVRDLTPFQRSTILKLSQHHARLTEELKIVKQMRDDVVTSLTKNVDSAWSGTDVQLTSFWNTYLLHDSKRERMLSSLIEHQKGIEEWRLGLEDEYQRHLDHLNEVQNFTYRLAGDSFCPYDPDGTIRAKALEMAQAEKEQAAASLKTHSRILGKDLSPNFTPDVAEFLTQNSHRDKSAVQTGLGRVAKKRTVQGDYASMAHIPPASPFLRPYPGIKHGPSSESGFGAAPSPSRPPQTNPPENNKPKQPNTAPSDHLALPPNNNRDTLRRHQNQLQYQLAQQTNDKTLDFATEMARQLGSSRQPPPSSR